MYEKFLYNGQTFTVLTFTVLCNTYSDNDGFLLAFPWLHPGQRMRGMQLYRLF